MKLIVGLGNPGKKYEKTRHNMGFLAIDRLAEQAKIDIDKEVFSALLGRGKIFNEDVILLKPQTYMNLSGFAVSQVLNYFKVNIEDLIVICDDMALEPGVIRLRVKGSSGGQKGLQNIIEQLGTEEFKRIRIGIGRPEFDNVDYVLSKPSEEEFELIDKALDDAVNAIKTSLQATFEKAMSLFN